MCAVFSMQRVPAVMPKLRSNGNRALLRAVLIMAVFISAPTAFSQEDTAELTIMCGPVQRMRLMEPMAQVFDGDHENIKMRFWRPYDVGRPWPGVLGLVARGRKGTDLMVTSRLDWKRRSTPEYREKLRYVPMAQQMVRRGDKVVGSVEYGVVFPQESPSKEVQAFLDFIDSEPMHAFLNRPDPYNFVPLDRDVKEFEPPEWFDTPAWEGQRPWNWHGVCQIWERYYSETVLAELKKVWMEGFNQVQGTILSEPVIEWAEEHGMVLTGLPSLASEKEKSDNPKQHYIARIRQAAESPVLRGLYYENEDFLNRIYYPLYTNLHRVRTGETEEKRKGVEAVQEQFPRWSRQRHGDLDTLNNRWDTSYESWGEVGFPQLPLDWVQELYVNTGLKEEDVGTENAIFTLFHQPLHFHLFADHPEMLDFQRYMREAWARKYKALEHGHGPDDQLWDEEFTNYARKLQPLIENGKFFYTTKTRLNPYLLRSVEEFNAAGFTHMICTTPPHYIQVPVDTVQIAQGKPMWNAEDHMYNHGTSTPRRVRYRLLQNHIMGMFKSTTYNRTSTFKSGRPDPGDFSTAERGAHHRVEVTTRNQIRRNEAAFRALYEARKDADISVLVTEGNRGWNTLPDHPERPELGGAVKAYAYVAALGRNWKYVLDEDVSDKHCGKTLIVDAPWLTEETLEKINGLSDDHRVVAVGEIPVTDEYGQRFPDEKLNQLRARTTVIDGWGELDEAVKPAEGLSGPFREIGRGSFWFWGRVAGTTNFTLPVPKLEARRARHEGNLYVAVTNHSSDREITAPIPWAGGQMVRELTVDEPTERVYPEGEYTSFPPYSVRVFEVKELE